ncbi:DUF748 domain-containing protein [Marinobacter halotolerans]|uniref:DUF748 domain-containing protein n=1 Tax=Marinobacter halotolerans TaxID=1569211 RepID=UPI001CDA1985|nr:DUF748 domain-containing protein [Marinobacter halotolerans]
MARKLSVIALILVVLYALAGFVVLPWWLERAIPERLEQHMGWQGTVESVNVNPFAMSIEMAGLNAQDGEGERVLAFERMYANLGFLRLATGIVALENFELDGPFARLDLQEDYSINLVRDWRANNPPAQNQPQPGAEPSDPVKVYLDRFRVTGGEVLFRDFSYEEPEKFQIAPLDLALNDLATWPREDGPSAYYLKAAIGSQTVEWDGDLSLTPLYSSGTLRIADVAHSTLAHFLRPYLPYSLKSGTLTVSSDYELQSTEQFSFSTSGGEVTITDLALAMTADSDTELLRSDRLQIPGVQFDLINRQLSVGTVALEKLLLNLQRNEAGVLNLMEPFEGDETSPAPASGSDQSPFRWTVGGVELTGGTVNWVDQQPGSAAELSAQQLDVTIGQLSHKLGEPVDYKAGLTLASGGRINLSGQTTLQPFTLEAGISVADLNLVPLSPYLSSATNLLLQDGLLGVDGNLDLDNQQPPLTGTFAGTAQLSSLSVRLEDSGESLLAWQNLRLDPVEYNLEPARLEIGTLTLSNPNMTVVREAGGAHNVAKIMSGTESATTTEAASGEGSDADSQGFIFRIGQILLESGQVSYADRTLEPVFSTTFDQLNGSVTGLSNVKPQTGKLSLQGRVGDVASLKLNGTIGTLGTEDENNLMLKLDGASMPALSPYLSQYLGYVVDSGKLTLDLDYKLVGSRIDASNRVLIDRLELGAPVASENAVNAPVKLGLALLRNNEGVIEVMLPIQGDLESPDFNIGPVIARTFVNLIAKAATSPFSMLGSLADMTGLTGEELGYVSFQPGKVALASGGEQKLQALSEALTKRPSLLLKVRGAASPEVDGQFLRRQKLAEQLEMSELSSAAGRIDRLESRYRDAGFEQSLDAFRQQVAGTQSGEPDDSAWEQALVNRLLSQVELAPEVLTELARQRGVWLSNTLREDLDVPEDQLFLLEPQQQAEQSSEGAVKVNFELEAR